MINEKIWGDLTLGYNLFINDGFWDDKLTLGHSLLINGGFWDYNFILRHNLLIDDTFWDDDLHWGITTLLDYDRSRVVRWFTLRHTYFRELLLDIQSLYLVFYITTYSSH